MPRRIEISHRTIIFTFVFLLFAWLLYQIREIILQFFVAILIMTILNPLVSRLSQRKVPRSLSILVVYFLLIGAIITSIVLVAPQVVEQSTNFVNTLPLYLRNIGIPSWISDQILRTFLSQLSSLPGQVAKLTISLFSNVLSVIAVLIFAFYLLLARDRLDDQLVSFLGEERKRKFAKILDLLENKLGGWARGELSLMTIVGLANYIGLALLGIPYALPLAIIAGLLEIVPYIGPFLAAVPPVIIGLGISPVVGLAAAALAFLIQQMENYIFVPKVMEKSVGVNPIITLLSLSVGLKLAGVVGAIISIPIVITLEVLVKEYLVAKSEN